MNQINQTSTNVSLGKRPVQDSLFFNPIYYKSTGQGNWYKQDLEYYNQPSFSPVSLPEKIQLEYCFKAKIHADYLMTFHNERGIMQAMTGLRKILIPDWYYGDQRSLYEGETITSLVLAQFCPDRSIFRLYLFDGYYPEGPKKKNEILHVVREISATGTAPAGIIKKLHNHKTYLKP